MVYVQPLGASLHMARSPPSQDKNPLTLLMVCLSRVHLILGPMGHSPRDLKLYCKVIVDSKPWLADPKIVPIPWRPVELPSQLCFAVIRTNCIINPLPPVARAMEITISRLKGAGHEIIDWDLSDQRDTTELGVIRVHYVVNDSINSLPQGEQSQLLRFLRNQANRSQKDCACCTMSSKLKFPLLNCGNYIFKEVNWQNDILMLGTTPPTRRNVAVQ